jgi:hypothetical protein
MRPLYLISLSLSAFLALQGCKKNDPDNPSETLNRPPDPFELTHVANGSADVDVMPTLTWKISKDPDGDSVVYDLYLKKENQEFDLLASGIHENSFALETRLITQTKYQWKVVAKDGKGGSCEAKTAFEFTTRSLKEPSKAIDEATSISRSGHTSVFFNNKIWTIAGRSRANKVNDIWSSEDAVTWESENASAPFGARSKHTSVLFDNNLWLIGGQGESAGFSDTYSDVWTSKNGVNWELINVAAGFGARSEHASAVFDNKIWVIGGMDQTGKKLNDIWYSTDGRNWAEATANAPFTPRNGLAAVVFQGKLWVISGNDSTASGSIWNTENGKDWTLVNNDPPFKKRGGHGVAVFDNKLWLVAGMQYPPGKSSLGNEKNDIWTSEDGITWIPFNFNSNFPARVDHTVLTAYNKLFILFGKRNSSYFNDVWYIE